MYGTGSLCSERGLRPARIRIIVINKNPRPLVKTGDPVNQIPINNIGMNTKSVFISSTSASLPA